ncbi:transposase [Bifidobacterium sp. GSD1FS]|uniref:Transposase n=2 Tax=Bifidobacterium canis TaxID=2610880 RepID=A0A7K1J726_9BIFI|nr:transposase [Bifidobacterium canis]
MYRMSQKVAIERVQVRGAIPYLGTNTTEDGQQVPLYSSNPDIVMRWLCDGWRCRYNQLRSRRQKWDKTRQALIPLGDEPDMRADKQARAECSWLAAIPAMILQSPNRIENTDWWSANKRRKTLRKQHRNPGMMPRFKSRRDDLYFVCWHNRGMNANWRQFNKHHGEIIITGQNPKPVNLAGQPCRYRIHIRVRVSQPIRDYTSIGVNWTRKTVVFINEPLPIARERTNRMVGLDRGVAHTLATSDGGFIDLPKARLARIDREIRRRQKAQARRVKLSGEPVNEYRRHASRAYRRTQAQIAGLYAKAHRIIDDWQHKTTTALVRAYDLIAIENLNLQGMTRRANIKPDPNHAGRFLPNGQAAKRGLNHSLRAAALGGIASKLEYKTQAAAHSRLILVNPAYTSRTCSKCGHCAKENRESQAVFQCQQCHTRMNADVNAAINILNRGVDHVLGLDEAERAITTQDARTVQHGESAIVARGTSTRP